MHREKTVLVFRSLDLVTGNDWNLGGSEGGWKPVAPLPANEGYLQIGQDVIDTAHNCATKLIISGAGV